MARPEPPKRRLHGPGRLETKLLSLLLLLTALPLATAFALSGPLFEQSLGAGLNPKIFTALDDTVQVHGDFIRAEKGRQVEAAARLAESRAIAHHAAQGPEALRAWLAPAAARPRVFSITVRGDTPAATIHVKNPALPFPGEWRRRTARQPLHDVPGYTSLEVEFGLEQAFLTRLTHLDTEVIGPFRMLAAHQAQLAQRLTLRFVGALAAAVLLAALISLFVGRRLTRRLKALRRGMDAIATGAHDVRVIPSGHDEISDLARGLNDMAQRLSDSHARVQSLTQMSAWQGIARRLAHEIKNPLTPILLSVQQVHQSYRGDDARYQRTLDTVREVVEDEVHNLKRLVENFSRFARLPEVVLRPLDLAAMVRDVGTAHPEIEHLEVSAPDVEIIAEVDRGLMRQALTNLLKNAAEASARPDGSGRVQLTVQALDHGVRLTIDDDGPGVPVAERERVFEPYITAKDQGTGLGLAIVKKIVLDHHGTVAITDAPLGGARVEIHLPRSVAKSGAD